MRNTIVYLIRHAETVTERCYTLSNNMVHLQYSIKFNRNAHYKNGKNTIYTK